jgi:hypothetical protein
MPFGIRKPVVDRRLSDGVDLALLSSGFYNASNGASHHPQEEKCGGFCLKDYNARIDCHSGMDRRNELSTTIAVESESVI